MADDRRSKGVQAENRALQFLLQKGWQLLCRNYRWSRGPSARAGEIDLIMRCPDATVVFVEVRLRSSGVAGGALASVDGRKQRHLIFAAQQYLQQWPDMPACRFDVIGMDGNQLNWVSGAFELDPF